MTTHTIGSLTLDTETRTLAGDRGSIRLSVNHYAVAERLFRRAGVIVTTAQLIEALYYGSQEREEPDTAENVVRVTISRLRGVLEVFAGSSVTIRNEPGVGYIVVIARAPVAERV